MNPVSLQQQRRRVLSLAAGSAVLGVAVPTWAPAKEFKIGFFIALSGPAALFGSDEQVALDVHEMLLTRCLSIAGGTTQILRNVVAERVLGLPRS